MINEVTGFTFSEVILAIILIVVFICAMYLTRNTEEIPEYRMYKHKIRSINYSNNVSGSFFLGTGNINSYDYYYIYVINDDTSISLNKYDTNYTKIFEDVESVEDSYIEIKQYNSYFSHNEYSMHIPKGYILYQIKLQGDLNE